MKGGTVIQIRSEAGINIIFKTAGSFKASKQNILTLLKTPGRTSSTIMAGLLAISATEPVKLASDLQLPRISVDFRQQVLKYINESTLVESFPQLGD